MTNSPASIGIILDGNRRWARERGLPTFEGHRRGFERTRDILSWASDAGIKEVTLYAFSTENWNRTPEEIAYLMDIFREGFEYYLKDALKRNKRLRFIGQRERMPEDLQELMTRAEGESANGTEGTLAIAVSYGGRAEILDAMNTLLAREEFEQVTEADLRSAMWSAGLLDPDLIIRTGGEQRLSNFLLWQSAYSELFFVDSKLPEFTKEEFDRILTDYAARERRHGK